MDWQILLALRRAGSLFLFACKYACLDKCFGSASSLILPVVIASG